jgi:hypothetical protein
MSNMRTAAVVIGMLAAVLAGCNKNKIPEPKTAATEPGATVSSNTSVALPQSQMPPSDASIPPSSTAETSSGDSGTPSQMRPKQLSKQEEQSSLPQSGQVNNYSVPETTPGHKQ